jgi:7,8-dihydroneopterin aldolase/epimerase/oxygenase
LIHQVPEDRITLAGAKIYPHIGTTLEERSTPQECQADLTIWGDFKAAASLDSLDHSIDYSKVLSTMQRTASRREFNLLETLAHEIIRSILREFPVSRVRIKLRKRPLSLIGDIDFVEVEMEDV